MICWWSPSLYPIGYLLSSGELGAHGFSSKTSTGEVRFLFRQGRRVCLPTVFFQSWGMPKDRLIWVRKCALKFLVWFLTKQTLIAGIAIPMQRVQAHSRVVAPSCSIVPSFVSHSAVHGERIFHHCTVFAFLRNLYYTDSSVFDFWIFLQEGYGECRAGSNSTLDRPPQCFACMRKLDVTNTTSDDQTPSVCGKCKNLFCFQCDVYIHEKLHNCPGCENVNAAGVWCDVMCGCTIYLDYSRNEIEDPTPENASNPQVALHNGKNMRPQAKHSLFDSAASRRVSITLYYYFPLDAFDDPAFVTAKPALFFFFFFSFFCTQKRHGCDF